MKKIIITLILSTFLFASCNVYQDKFYGSYTLHEMYTLLATGEATETETYLSVWTNSKFEKSMKLPIVETEKGVYYPTLGNDNKIYYLHVKLITWIFTQKKVIK